MVPEFDWPQIDTVLLDMDGTLLDLEFGNRARLPARRHRKARHWREYQAVQHTELVLLRLLGERLDLDIYRMTSEVGSRARLREHRAVYG